mmetsp:Transcript_31959/g.95704  ORF Transcript_31959/g.95704 Transcript_31959/m.95704 type:complete len:1312 (-) Transcript_31959:14-3949(-)
MVALVAAAARRSALVTANARERCCFPSFIAFDWSAGCMSLGRREDTRDLSTLNHFSRANLKCHFSLGGIHTRIFKRSNIFIASKTPTFSISNGCSRVTLCRPHSSSGAVVSGGESDKDNPEGSRSVEEQYSRKTPLEHVLLRPGMYVGPTQVMPPVSCWAIDPLPDNEVFPDVRSDLRMVQNEVSLIPALDKIFDEILVNASDNRLRHPKSCRKIDVRIDPGCEEPGRERPPLISITNDGKGIPVQVHRKEGIYIPELVFGHLLTGSNFDDAVEEVGKGRVTGGRHGYGAKLTNIFSSVFKIETADSHKGLRYSQTWKDNMSVAENATIREMSPGDKDFTTVMFVPDLPRLTGNPDVRVIPPADYGFMCRRVLDLAGCSQSRGSDLTVTLNGKPVPVAGFQEYASLFRSSASPPLVYQKINSRWEVAIGLSDSGAFESISFVNGMATPRGGTHVNAIVQQVTKMVADKINKEHPDLGSTVTNGLVKRNLCIFVNALIENPTFDSQMKEYLTSNPEHFGSKYNVSARFLRDIIRAETYDDSDKRGGPGIVEEVIRVARGRQQAILLKKVSGGKKTKRQVLSIPKLDDAHLAGTEDGSNCTLILTEGDSAKALAVAGLEVIGRDKHGVFPLRGKFLNVRDATVQQLSNNAEVKSLCSILGLDFEKEYATSGERDELRYGHVMLMTDQDTDGSHIKGLMMNFFRHFWPSLLKAPVDIPDGKPFLSSFITPLLKASKGKVTMSFYSMAEFQEWRNMLPNESETRGWHIKYFKGLGTSTPAEAKEYFSAFINHHRPFRWKSDRDGELLDMVFDKHRAADRREWILDKYDETSIVTSDAEDANSVSFEEFLNHEMIHFSNADNVRSIPSIIDGLKPSQRKVLYACFKRNLKKEIKVAQLAGYCAEHTAYHHGEASLHATITGMAQDFVGSNNINLLEPSGQFGTRLAGGKDAASPRYIFTRLPPVVRYLFPEVDDALLSHNEDDGQMIEPECYCPIIPLLLVNGAQGIGTGWSTFVPPHNPRDVLSYVRAKLDGDSLPAIRPWARGFTGEIECKEDGSGYRTRGKAKKISRTSVLISELPLGRWTTDYKNHLLKMRDRGEIQSFVENHTTSSVAFTVNLKSVQLTRMVKSGLHKAFKLESIMSCTNMHAFDGNNVIQKFNSPESMADAHFPKRLELYNDRKNILESTMFHKATLLRNKADFITAVTTGKIDIAQGQTSKADTVERLEQLNFTKLSDMAKQNAKDSESAGRSQKEEPTNQRSKEFDYLLNMSLSSLTTDKIDELKDDEAKTRQELDSLQRKSPKDLWRDDLDKLEDHI